ncbi:unnamed protein product [Periconia digitata]|uniref:Uncharacterized protein n=1 Tax=Periconia digitata TaxID=1303443 RepID=A0A9W4UUT5_9PLEO|nr:unnamed protein product [Periconia digitata]
MALFIYLTQTPLFDTQPAGMTPARQIHKTVAKTICNTKGKNRETASRASSKSFDSFFNLHPPHLALPCFSLFPHNKLDYWEIDHQTL